MIKYCHQMAAVLLLLSLLFALAKFSFGHIAEPNLSATEHLNTLKTTTTVASLPFSPDADTTTAKSEVSESETSNSAITEVTSSSIKFPTTTATVSNLDNNNDDNKNIAAGGRTEVDDVHFSTTESLLDNTKYITTTTSTTKTIAYTTVVPDSTGATKSTNGQETKKEEEESEEEYEYETESDNEGSRKNKNEENSDDEEEGYEECNLNQFLTGLNISQFLPTDSESLKEEYNAMENVSPKRKWVSPSVNFTMERLTRLLNLSSSYSSRQDLSSGIVSLLRHNYDLFYELDIDTPCLASIISTIGAIRQSKLWAMKIVDSMAKPPSGILSGVTSFLGDFDQCLSVKSPETAVEEFTGQYCLLRPILPLPDIKKYNSEWGQSRVNITHLYNFLESYSLDGYFRMNPVLKFIEHMKSVNGRVFNFGICMPDLCTPEKFENSINRLMYHIVGIPFEIQNSSCWTMAKTQDVSSKLNRYSQFAIMTLSLLSVLVILCSIGDYLNNCEWRKYLHRLVPMSKSVLESNPVHSFVSIFSAISNTKLLLAPGESRMAVFDTLRLLIVILIGLSNAFYKTPQTTGLKKMTQSVPYELLSDWKYFFIRAPSLLNDGLLVIAGALFVRSIFAHLNSPHDLLSHILYMIRRWLRLTAPLFGSIMFIYILPLLNYGPLWERINETLLPACMSPSSLASSLLHYSNWNFVRTNYSNGDAFVVCNPDTWFVSLLFQLNILFFGVVVFMCQSPRNGLRLLVLFILSGILLNISPKLFQPNTRTYYELTKQPSFWHLRRNLYLYHQNIVQYIGSFSVGLLLGYALIANDTHQKHQQQQSLSIESPKNRKSFFYNLLSIGTIVLVFCWVNQFFVQNVSPSETSVLLFFSVGRLAFSLALAWICYACITKRSEMLETILCAPLVQPIARLSFSIFLVLHLAQYYRMYSIRDTYVMTFAGTIENFIIDFMISTVVAYVLHLLFEAPSHRLNELFCGRMGNFYDDNLNNYVHAEIDAATCSKDKSCELAKLNGEKRDSISEEPSLNPVNGVVSCSVNSQPSSSSAPNGEYLGDNEIISIRF